MIYSINYKNLKDLYNSSSGDQLLFNPIFSRKCGKTSALVELAAESNGYYVGKTKTICKIAKNMNPNIKTISYSQLVNYLGGGLEIGSTLFVDELGSNEIEHIKNCNPHLRIFGFVNGLEIQSFRTIQGTEMLLGENESLFSEKNKNLMDQLIKEHYHLRLEHIA